MDGMPAFRSPVLIFIFMTYYLIAISCPALSSERVKRNLAIYVDRSSSIILGVGVMWPFGRRCCCNNRTSATQPPAITRNPMPGTPPATRNTFAPTIPTAPTGPPLTPPGPGPDTTPPDTVTIPPAPGSPLQRQRDRGRARGLLVRHQSQRNQKLNDGCICSTTLKSGSRRLRSGAAESGQKSRLSVTSASEKDRRKGAKLAVNATSVPDRNSSAGLREHKSDPEHRKRGCILFRSRVYCMQATG